MISESNCGCLNSFRAGASIQRRSVSSLGMSSTGWNLHFRGSVALGEVGIDRTKTMNVMRWMTTTSPSPGRAGAWLHAKWPCVTKTRLESPPLRNKNAVCANGTHMFAFLSNIVGIISTKQTKM